MLLVLPDPCLVAVLQCCAGEPRSVCSAARAHSRLHQAAVLALSSITVSRAKQQDVDSMLLYLSKHSQDVHSMDLQGVTYLSAKLCQLPSNLHLDSLQLTNLRVQLQPRKGQQGVIRPGVPLKQLRLQDCMLLDWAEGLAAALALLPGLQHLRIRATQERRSFGFPMTSLLGLQQLTHLELDGVMLRGPYHERPHHTQRAHHQRKTPALQPLQALTQLADLRLRFQGFEPQKGLEAVCELTGLRSLTVYTPGEAEGLLLQLPQLTQLTNLDLTTCVGYRSMMMCLVQQVGVSTSHWL
jgi:hypothetical protein